jgi:hypothetical protein
VNVLYTERNRERENELKKKTPKKEKEKKYLRRRLIGKKKRCPREEPH